MSVASLTELVGAPRLGQRQDPIDDRHQIASVDQFGNLRKLRAIWVTGNENGLDAERFSFVRRWRLDDRQKDPTFLQHLPRTLLRIAADWIEHDVDFPRDVFEALLGVIDRLVHTELAQQVLIFSRGRRENVRAFPFCELDGEMTDSAAAGVNQHALAWLQLRGVE